MLHILKRMGRKEWIMAAICVLLILGQIYFDLTMPDYMSSLTQLIQTPGSAQSEIWSVGAKMLGCALASTLLAVICGYLAAQIAAGFSFKIRAEIFEKVTDFDKEEMDHFSVPSLITRSTNDVTQIQMLIALGLQMVVKAPIMAVWAVLKIIGKSWELSLVTGGFVLVLLVMMGVLLVILVPRFKRVQKLTDDINRVARENLNGINVVHAFNAEAYQNEKFKRANDTLTNTQLFNQRAFSLLMPVMTLAMNGLALAIFWVGGTLIENIPLADMAGRLSLFSEVVVFSTYAMYVVMSLMMIVMIFMFLPAAQVSAGRINEVLRTTSKIKSGSRTEGTERGTVEFRNVAFRYPEGGRDVLQDISFKVDRGKTIAFIGATGCGKTTLVSLAARLYDATAGQVLVDGVDIREYSFDTLYNKVAYVPQKAVLFSGSVADNVNFGESGETATEAGTWQALELAQAQDFVQEKAGKLHAPIEQGGRNVSGGQKQRLSIARALARKPEILIFDDSFSALDYRTDAALRAGLREKLSGTTLMIVAQRIGTIRNADKIVVLDQGQIVGMGRHEELLKNCAVYKEIAMSQLSPDELGA